MMNEKAKQTISKFLSLVLRHNPGKIGIVLDENGWANVDDLIARAGQSGPRFSREELNEIVATNDKQRFSFSEDGSKIRANQGHSIDVELELMEMKPPDLLFHGTVDRFVGAIRVEGLKKMQRHHVHLSKDRETAKKVGDRRGEAVILVIRSGEMSADGIMFYISANGVWLTDQVPVKYIEF